MDQAIVKSLMVELNTIEDDIKKISEEYNTKLAELGNIYDKKLDELRKNYDAKWDVLKVEIAKE